MGAKKSKGGCMQNCIEVDSTTPKCTCDGPAWKINKDGKTCDPVHKCDQGQNGGCSHNCTENGDEVLCKCPEHYKLKPNNKDCVFVHPCDRVSNGDCEEICRKLDGKNHDCQCPKGFE